MKGLLIEFFSDAKVKLILVAVAVDFILGVAAAFRLGVFKFSYVAQFLRDDILAKLVPYGVLYAGAWWLGDEDVIGPLDLGDAAGAAFAAFLVALAGSITASLIDLGLPVPGREEPPPRGRQTIRTALGGEKR
jgi:hypothetical protein